MNAFRVDCESALRDLAREANDRVSSRSAAHTRVDEENPPLATTAARHRSLSWQRKTLHDTGASQGHQAEETRGEKHHRAKKAANPCVVWCADVTP